MKVWQRVLFKTVTLLLVVAVFGGGAAGWRAYQQSTPDYAVEQYLSLLIENGTDKAYALLDQSQDSPMSSAEYTSALEARKYSLYSSYEVKELEKRRDSDGNEYVDYQAQFKNAEGDVQAEEDFTVRKQAEAAFGIFDKWKVLSGHCLVKDFQVTVPAGSEVYLDNELADTSWITREGVALSYDRYLIPSVFPGDISIVVRHPALESVNTTADTLDGSVDYSGKMALKTSSQDACKELAVSALKQLYASAASNKTDELELLFADCLDAAETFAGEQSAEFNQESAVFKNAAVSDFAAQFGDLVFTEEADGAITVEMTFSYHYVVRQDIMTGEEEVLADGTVVDRTEESERAGDNTAKFVMAFADGEWTIASMEVPVIPENA